MHDGAPRCVPFSFPGAHQRPRPMLYARDTDHAPSLIKKRPAMACQARVVAQRQDCVESIEDIILPLLGEPIPDRSEDEDAETPETKAE